MTSPAAGGIVAEQNVKTNRKGLANFKIHVLENVDAGEDLTTTATRFATADTSEFSAPLATPPLS